MLINILVLSLLFKWSLIILTASWNSGFSTSPFTTTLNANTISKMEINILLFYFSFSLRTFCFIKYFCLLFVVAATYQLFCMPNKSCINMNTELTTTKLWLLKKRAASSTFPLPHRPRRRRRRRPQAYPCGQLARTPCNERGLQTGHNSEGGTYSARGSFLP